MSQLDLFPLPKPVNPGFQPVMICGHSDEDGKEDSKDSGDLEKAGQELGDVLFVVANIARTLDIDPEDALRYTNAKFVRRFGYVERRLAELGKDPAQSDLGEMDALWEEVKAKERAGVAD